MKHVPNLRHPLAQIAALAVLHWLLLAALAWYRLPEHLLAPGTQSRLAIIASMIFLSFRLLLYVFGPGWLIASLWLQASRRR